MPSRQYIQDLADQRFTGEMRNAFMAAVDKISDSVVLEDIAAKIEARDLQGAVENLNLKDEVFDPVKAATAAGFGAAGKKTMDVVPPASRGGQKIKVTFNSGDRRAVQAVDNLHTNLIREVTDETRGAVAQEIRDGLERGKNPRSIARAIRGKYNYATKQYDNGVVGLTRQQQRWVSNAERQLMSGDPKEMRQYLGRKLRDRRYDRTVLKAINEERALTQAEVDKMSTAYRRRAVKYRSETIARDQSLEALTQGQETAMDQAVDQGAVENRDFIKEWTTSRDARVRDVHARVPGMNRGGIRRDRMFETPLGPLKRPRDRTSPGSVAANIIQCFLPGNKVQGNILACSKSWYSGDAFKIQTSSGANVSVTSNHPIMTSRGFIPANEISEGDYLINADRQTPSLMGIGNDDIQSEPPFIENIYSALEKIFIPVGMGGTEVDFHGDGRFMDGDVNIILPNLFLMRTVNAELQKFIENIYLKQANAETCVRKFFCGLGGFDFLRKRFLFPSRGSIGSSDLAFNFFRIVFFHLFPFYQLCFRPGSGVNSIFGKSPHYSGSADPEFFGEFFDACSGKIFFDQKTGINSEALSMPQTGGAFIPKLDKPFEPGFMQNSVNSSSADVKSFHKHINSGTGLISFDKVVSVDVFNFSDHVYDLQTDSGLVVADGIVCSNCRCSQFIKVRRNNQ